jgi:hypothetical protein
MFICFGSDATHGKFASSLKYFEVFGSRKYYSVKTKASLIFFFLGTIGEKGLTVFFLKPRKEKQCDISWPGIGMLWLLKITSYQTEPTYIVLYLAKLGTNDSQQFASLTQHNARKGTTD